MLSIACVSQKGGVGKSTLARLLARTYAANDWAVQIADFNTKQMTATEWAALRMEHGIEPVVEAAPFASLKSALRQADKLHLMVFDGRPDSDTSTLELAREAHLVIIPCGVSRDDLVPQIKFAMELDRRTVAKQKMVFVLNKATSSEIAVQDARAAIEGSGFSVAKADLRWQTGYSMAQDQGRAISETSFPTLNDRAELLAADLVRRLNQITGRKP